MKSKQLSRSDLPSPVATPRRTIRSSSTKNKPRSRPILVTRYYTVDDEGTEWEKTSLVVRLRFQELNDTLQKILVEAVPWAKADTAQHHDSAGDKTTTIPNPFLPSSTTNDDPQLKSPNSFESSTTPEQLHNSDMQSPSPEASLPSSDLSTARWTDPTTPFNMKTIVAFLRPSSEPPPILPASHTWFSDAVPTCGLLPPGVPLTAIEILAFYPHHIRYPSIMSRLANNTYRAPDIMPIETYFRLAPGSAPSPSQYPITLSKTSMLMRDALATPIPDFKAAPGAWSGTPTADLSTENLGPGRYLLARMGGCFTVPTFAQLVKDIRVLPQGVGARELTACLKWWVKHTERTHKLNGRQLEITVLHVQSLIRALRVSLPPYEGSNLDIEAVQEWRENKWADHYTEDEDMASNGEEEVLPHNESSLARSRLEINIKEETITPHLTLQIRHILTFPFMSILNMAHEGVALAVRKADPAYTPRSETEVELETGPEVEPESIFTTPLPKPMSPSKILSVGEALKGYRIPKRRREPLDDNDGEEVSPKRFKSAHPSQDTMNRSPDIRSSSVKAPFISPAKRRMIMNQTVPPIPMRPLGTPGKIENET